MAVNSSRSQRMDFFEGGTDGKYRKVRPNTSRTVGVGDEQTIASRQHLHPDFNYDFIDREVPLAQRIIPGC